MRAKDLRIWIVAATLGATALMGSTAAASDYPPGDNEPVPTVPEGGSDTPTGETSTGGQLPATGSDPDAVLKIAGGAVIAGAGLLVATRLRRRASTA